MITKTEQTAAIAAVHKALEDVIAHFVPAMFETIAIGYLDQHVEIATNVANAALLAVENLRKTPAITPDHPAQTPPASKP